MHSPRRWKVKGDEKQQAQSFWQDLLKSVYGIENPTYIIKYEKPVRFGGTTEYIDGYIESTRVLIEQKGQKIDPSKPERQSDGTELTPYEQGKRYAGWLPVSEQPRWIVVSDFQTFEIHDQEDPNGEPPVIALEDLPKANATKRAVARKLEEAQVQLERYAKVTAIAGPCKKIVAVFVGADLADLSIA